jgi:hypothetical protein
MSAGTHENLGTQSSSSTPLSGRSQRPLSFSVSRLGIEDRDLEAGGMN